MRASEGRLKLHIRDGESRRKAGVLYRGAIGALLAAALLWVLFGGLDLSGAGLPRWAAILGGAIGLVLTQVSGLGTPSEEGTARRGGLAAAIAILAVMLLALVLHGQFSGGLNAKRIVAYAPSVGKSTTDNIPDEVRAAMKGFTA